MDSSTSGSTCPTCGVQVEANHTCPEDTPTGTTPVGDAATSSAYEETGRFQIPEALRNTGLFRAPWRPSPDQAAPETVSNIFARVEEENPVSDPQQSTTPGPATEPEPVPAPETFQDVETPDEAFAPAQEQLPEEPLDPWAGLDTTLTPVGHEAVEDPWAHLSETPVDADLDAAEGVEPVQDAIWATPAVDEAPVAEEAWAADDEAEPVEVEPEEFATESFEAPEAEDVAPEDVTPDTSAEEFASEELAPEALDEPAREEADPISAAEDDFWWEGESPELTATDLPVIDAELPEPEATDGDLSAAGAAALSPIAAAEAAAVATQANGAAGVVAPALDETAAIDLDAAFAAEAAAASDAHLEQVPEPEQSAWDLYGDTLYAPEETSTDTTVAAPHEGDTTFVPGLSAAGVQSASLPSSVPFAPGIGVDGQAQGQNPSPAIREVVEEPAERKSRKGLVAGVVALALVAGGGGWFWWNSQKDAPVKDAFATSHQSFTKASTQLDQAESISEIASAGAAFTDVVPALTRTEEATRENDSDVSVAARRATVAERAVAEAAAPLAELSAADLSAWSGTKAALATSLEGLADVSDDIETAGGDAGRLLDPTTVERLQDVIAEEVVSGAGDTVTDLSAKLESATLLADVRAVGTSAGEYVTPLKEAADGLDDPNQQSDLNAVVEFHEALSGFSKIRAGTFDAWADLRKEAETAAKELETGRDEAIAGIKAADTLVTSARETFEKWETKRDEVKSERVADLAALETAETTVKAADSSFTTLTSDLATLLREVRALPAEGTEGDAYKRLDAAATAREKLLADLKGLTITPGPTTALEPLVATLTRDSEAVRAAAGAAGRCVDDCTLTETAGWRGLGAGTSSSGTEWAEALTPFLESIEKARERVEARELPKRPKI